MKCRVQETTWSAIAVVLALQVASSIVINAVVFQGEVVGVLRRLHRATGGLVEPTLAANLIPLVVVVGIGVLMVGRLKPGDLGLTRSALPLAVATTLAFWLVVQTAFILFAWSDDKLAWHPAWSDPGAGYVIGGLLGQLFGNALAEEAVFRGFLFRQLLIKFRRRYRGRSAFILAALISQVAFALTHLPNRLLVKGIDSGVALVVDQTLLVFHGLVFLALFLASRNLLVAVGVHALWNDPVHLVESPGGVTRYLVTLGASLALAGALRAHPRR